MEARQGAAAVLHLFRCGRQIASGGEGRWGTSKCGLFPWGGASFPARVHPLVSPSRFVVTEHARSTRPPHAFLPAPSLLSPSAMYGTGKMARFIAAGGSKANEFRIVDKDSGRPVARFADLASAVNGIDLMQGDDASLMAVICEHSAYFLPLPQ